MGEAVEKIENKFAMVLYIAGSIFFGGVLATLLRGLDVMAGRTLSSAAIFLGVAACGILLGAAASFCRGSSKGSHTALFCTVFLAGAAYLIFVLSAMDGIANGWQNILVDTTRTYARYLKLVLKTSAVFVLFFGILAGAAYGAAFRSKKMAFAFSWSSCGALAFVCGWWIFGAFCVAVCGFGVTLRLLVFLLALTAAIFPALSFNKGLKVKACFVLIFMVSVGTWFYTASFNMDSVLSAGTFGRLVYRDSGFAMGEPVVNNVSLQHTTSVFEDPDYKFVFAMDGRSLIFGNRFHTSRTLNAYLPLIAHLESRKVLLAGAEAGLFAPFFVRAGVEELSYCEAESSVVELAVQKDAQLCGLTNSCMASIQRGGFSGKYDLVYLTPEPLYMRGTAGYFTKRAFKRASKALNPNGIVALHLDARALSPEGFASVAGSMHSVFPYMQVWSSGIYDWVLAGSSMPLKLDCEAALKLFERDQVFKDFVRAGKLTIADLAACMVCDARGVDKWLEQSRRVPFFQVAWSAPRAVFGGDNKVVLPGMLEKFRQFDLKSWFLQGVVDDDIYAALKGKIIKNVSARMSAVIAVSNMACKKTEAGLHYAREAAAMNGQDVLLIQLSEMLELEARRKINVSDFKGAVRCYENLLSFSDGSPQAHYGMGYCLRANNDKQNAYTHFARAVVGAPDQIDYRLEFAEAAIAMSQYAVAEKQYEIALEMAPDDAQILMLYAKVLIKKERDHRDFKRAIELAERACKLTEWDDLIIGYGLADIYMEAGRVMEGMGLRRTLKSGMKPALHR